MNIYKVEKIISNSDLLRVTNQRQQPSEMEAGREQGLTIELGRSESESHSVVFNFLQPYGLSMEFSRPEYWSG